MSSEARRPDAGDATTALLGRAEGPRQARVLVFWEGGSVAAALPEGGSVTIGRSRECEVVVDHPSISRRHVTVHDGASSLEVEDLGSSNGTTVDGIRLAAGQRAAVAPRSIIEIGACMLMVQMPRRDETGPSTTAAMGRVQQLLDLVAKSDISVLLLGETGVGKDVAAERVHVGSARSARPFVRLNCASLPDNLLESELFGYERGAFSGAVNAKPGLLETAHGGTCLLDEIGELALPLQAKLLRALETREVLRLGATAPRKIDVRFLSATNRDLSGLAAEGRFRADLYYRINGITIAIPPLRERREEIVPLAERFLAELARAGAGTPARLSAPAVAALQRHAWPGNVRELKNVIERAALLAGGAPIGPEHLQLQDAPVASSGGTAGASSLRAELGDAARRAILEALERTGGNQTEAAKLLGISRRALLYRLEQMDLPRPRKGKLSGS